VLQLQKVPILNGNPGIVIFKQCFYFTLTCKV